MPRPDVIADPVAVQDLHAGKRRDGDRDRRMGLVLVDAEAERHVLGVERFPVVPIGAVAQAELDPGAVGGDGDAFGDQTVDGGGLGGVPDGEAVVDVARRVAARVHAAHGVSERHPVEGVPTARVGHAHETALGGVGIHPVEVLEVGRELRLAQEGVGMTAGRGLGVGLGVGCVGVRGCGRGGKYGGEREPCDPYAELHSPSVCPARACPALACCAVERNVSGVCGASP